MDDEKQSLDEFLGLHDADDLSDVDEDEYDAYLDYYYDGLWGDSLIEAECEAEGIDPEQGW